MTMLSTSCPIFLPKEIIIDMLSYLPVKSLLRFKCVCNHWNVITQDFQFICLNYKRTPSIYYKKPPQTQSNSTAGEDEFKLLYSRGLQLEYATRPSHFPNSPNFRHRIRNPEMQHQILEIPDSQSCIVNMCIVFDPDYQVLKLLSFVYDFLGDQALGYEVLDLRNEESTYSWQPLKLPQQSRGETRMCTPVKKYSKQIKFLTAMGTTYSMWDTVASSRIGIDILDMVNDSYIGHITFPTSYYTKDDCILWNGKFSFAKIVKEELHVLVLDDYKKQQIKWAEKLIIKLPFMRELSAAKEQITVVLVRESKLWFWWKDKDKEPICFYDITTGKVKTFRQNRELINAIRRPCLVTFRRTNAVSSSSQ